MNKKKQLALVAAVAGVVALGGYSVRAMHYRDRFLPKTAILGVKVANKTVAEANATLKKAYNQKQYQFVDGQKVVATATGAKLGLDHDYTARLKALMKQQKPWQWTAVVLAGTDGGEQVALPLSEAQLTEATQTLAAQMNAKRQQPVSAQIVSDGGHFTIKKEVAGNWVEAKALKTQVVAALEAKQNRVDLTKTYAKPKVTASAPVLTRNLKILEQAGQVKAKLQIQQQTVEIPAADVQSWLGVSGDDLTVNETAISNYLIGLNKTYATINKVRQFKSTKRGVVNVPAGTYGWSIEPEATAKKLAAKIKAGGDFTMKPEIQGSGYHADGSDIGDTYVEVDKENQHEWYYENGKLVLETPIVTGKPGQDTPAGNFFVWIKQRNTTLRGKNDDGSKYASPVSYWMPIDYTGVGLHDSPWQPKYGGDWWKLHGSHGCVNTPPKVMAEVYEKVKEGTPVIVF